MKSKNIQTIFYILKELILLIKLIVDEWEKDEENGEEKNAE
jgi:hypothetical protein